jgi:hypothetical protein
MAEAQMVLGLVGRVLGAPQLPGQALTVLGHPNVVLGPARGVLGRFKVPGHKQSILGLVDAKGIHLVVANEGLEWFDASLKPRSLTHHRI